MRNNYLILLLIVVLCLPVLSFAETIVLKSGKTVEGKLIEKTDKYIKIDFQGVPIIYYFDEIDAINETKISLPASNVSLGFTESNQQVNDAAYEDWIKTREVSDYLGKASAIFVNRDAVMSQYDRSLKQAMEKRDRVEWDKLLSELGVILSSFVSDLKSLNPPEELKDYHKKLTEFYNYLKIINDATQKNDSSAIDKYSHLAETSMTETLGILKKVFISHNAPREALNAIDIQLAGIPK